MNCEELKLKTLLKVYNKENNCHLNFLKREKNFINNRIIVLDDI